MPKDRVALLNNIKKNSHKIFLPGQNSHDATRFGLIELVFSTVFILNYLYLNRLLLVVTNDRFRLGAFVLGVILLAVIINLRIVKNIYLVIAIFLLCIAALFSSILNNTPYIQTLAFIRIPVTYYLIYYLVWAYLRNDDRIIKLLRLLIVISIFQLPIIAIQRMTYSSLPERFRLTTTLVDFGMGTFSGDTVMAFTLIGLIILLLFEPKIGLKMKAKWFVAGWLSITVLFSNSQIQHITIVIVWLVFLLSHLRLKTIIIGSTIIISVGILLVLFSTSRMMTFPYLENTLRKISEINKIFEENIDYSTFLSGKHDRAAALHYYLNQPIKWLGDGPGTVYDTASEERSVGGYGHIFTFYAEVGLIGLIISLVLFFLVSFPLRLKNGRLLLRISLIGILMFISVILVSVVKYPMGDSSLAFTYCVILISHHKLSRNVSSRVT